MKFHIAQKIGLAGIAFIAIIALVFYLGGYYSPYIFAGTIPFCVLVLIGYSIKNSKKRKSIE